MRSSLSSDEHRNIEERLKTCENHHVFSIAKLNLNGGFDCIELGSGRRHKLHKEQRQNQVQGKDLQGGAVGPNMHAGKMVI